jgi:anti-sigma-K factor RskA
MARNDTRRFRTQPADRAHPRAGADSGADSWRALANLTVASALVVAAVVSVLTLLEAVFSKPASMLARQSPTPSELQSWRARAQPHEPFLPTPAQGEPALFVAD